MKRFLYYIIWMTAIMLLCYWGLKIQLGIQATAEREFNFIALIIYSLLFPIVVGLLLRLPRLIIERKENKKWEFDWVKFIGIALAPLFIIILFIWSLFNLNLSINFMIIGNPTLLTITGIILGYTLLDCLKKPSR